MTHPTVQELWEQYNLENPDAPSDYDVWAFGDSAAMADDLLALVLEGKKTATASNYRLYELEQEPIPYEGLYNVILNGKGEAKAIIKTTSIEIIPFKEVPAEFAYLEGEGDRSLAYWRNVHEAFFKREFMQIEEEFNENMLVVCEKFKLVYQK